LREGNGLYYRKAFAWEMVEVDLENPVHLADRKAARAIGVLAMGLLVWCGLAWGQEIPAGVTIPVMLNSGLNSNKSKAGQQIDGKTMQEVPLTSGVTIGARSKVIGHVVSVAKGRTGEVKISVKFEQIEIHGHMYPLLASLRALGSTQDVFQAGLPIAGSPDYESSNQWFTQQVGGDIVNRSQGQVGTKARGVLGRWNEQGVWAKLDASPDASCRDESGREQALWVFSTSACGVYGWDALKLEHSGQTNPLGEIVLASMKKVDIRGGSGWLLMTETSVSPAK
jgi:hypothetical protein